MANTELSWLSIAEAARLIAARELSPLELTDEPGETITIPLPTY